MLYKIYDADTGKLLEQTHDKQGSILALASPGRYRPAAKRW